jgi:hypothetical protein
VKKRPGNHPTNGSNHQAPIDPLELFLGTERDGDDETRRRRDCGCTPRLTCGDVDAQWAMAESIGDEIAGGSGPTPDQSVVEEIALALGMLYNDDEQLKFGEKERERDLHRWELDPASSEDYIERLQQRGTCTRMPRSPFVR